MILVPIQEESDIINLQQISKSDLNELIQFRVEEILKLIKEKINSSVFKSNFAKSFIITGGGSMLTGMREFMSQTFKRPVMIKRMDNFSEEFGLQIGNDFATTIGLIKFALLSDDIGTNRRDEAEDNRDEGLIKKTINWIENNL